MESTQSPIKKHNVFRNLLDFGSTVKKQNYMESVMDTFLIRIYITFLIWTHSCTCRHLYIDSERIPSFIILALHIQTLLSTRINLLYGMQFSKESVTVSVMIQCLVPNKWVTPTGQILLLFWYCIIDLISSSRLIIRRMRCWEGSAISRPVYEFSWMDW